MHLLHRLLTTYTLAYFRGLRAYSVWIASHTARSAEAACLIIATVFAGLAIQSTFPRWLALMIGVAGTVPYLFVLYMFLRSGRKKHR